MIRNRLFVLLLFCFFGFAIPAETLRVHFIDVGQGEAVLLETSNAAVLVDAGSDGTVADYLARTGIRRLDLVVATHAHADHVGGFPPLFSRMPVARVWYNGQTHTTRTFERFLDAVSDSGAVYEEPRRGERAQLGNLTITVLHPPGSAADYEGHLHDMNIVVRATYGDFSVLVTGDAETFAERMILQWVRSDTAARGGIQSTVLQLGHHGSFTSSSTAFLEAVAPRIVVYQAGRDNRYGHPHDVVIRRVRETTAARILGTDRSGTIVIETDGRDFAVRTERTEGPACIDLNTATRAELSRLVHIGEARAQRIIELRPFRSLNELTRIPGIGPARAREIEEQGLLCPLP